jgi:hypothetical protein
LLISNYTGDPKVGWNYETSGVVLANPARCVAVVGWKMRIEQKRERKRDSVRCPSAS